jgi:hypothetical protein
MRYIVGLCLFTLAATTPAYADTLTADTTVKDEEGNDTKPSNLVGTKVKVVSEHAKADSVEQMA